MYFENIKRFKSIIHEDRKSSEKCRFNASMVLHMNLEVVLEGREKAQEDRGKNGYWRGTVFFEDFDVNKL